VGFLDSLWYWLASIFQPAPAPQRLVYVGYTVIPISAARLDDNGLAFLKAREGWRSKPYRDIKGNLTIGHGHLIIPGDGLSVSSVLTPEQGEIILRRDVAIAESAVRRAIKVPVSQNQFNSMVSYAFNIGGGAFAGSDVAKYLNASDPARARASFYAKPIELAGRRALEQELFSTI